MARTKQDPSLSKKHVISLYLSDAENEIIRHNAKHAGLSLSAYVRKLALEGKVETRYILSPQINDLAPILAQLGKTGSNINQIARYFNSGGNSTDDIKRELRECMAK